MHLSRSHPLMMGHFQSRKRMCYAKNSNSTIVSTSAQQLKPTKKTIILTISPPQVGLRCFLLNRRLARAGLTAGTSLSWSARLGAKIGRSTLLAAMLARSRTGTFSPICRVDSKKDRPCDEPDSGPVELLTSTRRVRWRSCGGLWSRRNGLSVKMRRRKRGMAFGLFLREMSWQKSKDIVRLVFGKQGVL
jgi:hypothetical protein